MNDIEILEELIKNEHGELLNCWDYGEEAKQAIENLLKRNKELEKGFNNSAENEVKLTRENTSLKSRIKDLEERIESLLYDVYNHFIRKSLIKEKIEELKKYRDIAKELIEERVVIADSDSLNYGRAEAHDKDIQVLEELLKGE